MPLAYTGSAGVFTHLGKIIARVNSYASLGTTTLPADLLTLLTAFGTTWLPEEGVAAYYGSLGDSVTAWRQGLASFADRRLADPATVQTQFSAPLDPGAGLGDVLPALVRQMILDAQGVKACTCTAGPVTAQAGNHGTGQAFLDLVLDGFSPPLLGGAANLYYSGLASQMCVPSETHTLECVGDSAIDGLTEGGELWSWTGAPAYPDLSWQPEGSGQGPTLQTDNEGPNLLQGGDMETFSGNVPVGWTLLVGTPGVSMLADTTAANVFRGTSSTLFAWDGSNSTVTLTQPIAAGLVQGLRRYRVSLAAKAAFAPGVTFKCLFSGTGYTATDGIQVSGGSLASYQLLSFTTTMPAPLPLNWALNISAQGLGAGSQVWVDSVSLAPVTYHGGVSCNVVAGSTPWRRGDRLTFPTSNDGAGKFQSFFRRHYLTQLPSTPPGAVGGPFLLLPLLLAAPESIPDGLVN